MSTLYLAIFGVAALAFGMAVLERTIVRTSLGTGIVLSYFVLELSGLAPEPSAVGSVNIGLSDVVSVLLITAATARLLRTSPGPRQQLLLLLAAIALYSLVRGVLQFGPQTAVNEARSWLLFLGTATYCAAAGDAQLRGRTLARQIQWAGLAVAAIACMRWLALAAGVSLGPLTPDIDSLRVVPSDGAFLTAQAFLLTTPAWQERADRWLYATSAGLLGVTVLLQHRTAWIALVVALTVLVWRDRELGRRLTTLLVIAAFAVAVAAITVLGSDSDELTDQATNSQTLWWRVAGWTELVVDNGPTTPSDIAVGMPFGSGWERQVDDITREERPHSQYIETFLRLGVVGLLLLLVLYAGTTRQLLSTPGRLKVGHVEGRLAAYLLTFQMVFALTYVPPASGAVVLGLAIAAARRHALGDPAAAATGTPPAGTRLPMS